MCLAHIPEVAALFWGVGGINFRGVYLEERGGVEGNNTVVTTM